MTPSDPPAPPQLTRLWRSVPLWIRNAAPILAVIPGAFAGASADLVNDSVGPQLPNVAQALMVVVAGVIVGFRLRFPRLSVAAAITASVVGLAVDGPAASFQIMLMIVVFSVSRHTNRRTGGIATAAAAVIVGIAAVVVYPDVWGTFRPFVQVAGLVGFAGAAGDASRSRQAFIDTMTERARRAEETKEAEARSRVAEERMAIARDLHDVMAHQIAVINMHANVATQALRTRPDDAEKSLVTIREAARTVLAEIASLLNVLRASPSPSAGQPLDLAPVPGLGELDRLIAAFTRSGLRVDVRTLGEPYPVPETVDLVAYRVIQEGLTNAQKHGSDSSALLQVEYHPHLLEVTVTNTIAANSGAGHAYAGGHGLTGARERVATVQGTLDASFGPGPVHRLRARLPLDPTAAPA